MFEAPELIAIDDEGCFFHRQPETPSEVGAAIEACNASCIANYRYSGNDLEVLTRMAEAGLSALCDQPITRSLVVRDRVRFSMPNGIDARGVAAELAEAYIAASSEGSLHGTIEGDKRTAQFACRQHPKALPSRYSVEWVSPAGSVGTAYRDADPRSQWLLISTDGTRQSMRFHEKLLAAGAADLRWFSRDEWAKNAPRPSLSALKGNPMATKKTFQCKLFQDGSKCAVKVPFDPSTVFGKVRVPVKVTLNGYMFRSTIMKYGTEFYIPLRKSNREAAGLEGNETLKVTLELDEEKREVKVPTDLVKALKAAGAWENWKALSFTHQTEHVEALEGAKKPETRARRLEKTVTILRDA